MNRNIAVGVFMGLIPVIVLVALSGSDGNGQPIPFSHKRHAENEIACELCHQSYQESARAGMPGVETCKTCHEGTADDSPAKSALMRYINASEEIPWLRVYRVPSDVLFSHRRHVRLAKLDCSSCHGAVELADVPLLQAAITPEMNRCIDCHRKTYRNPNECLYCHR